MGEEHTWQARGSCRRPRPDDGPDTVCILARFELMRDLLVRSQTREPGGGSEPQAHAVANPPGARSGEGRGHALFAAWGRDAWVLRRAHAHGKLLCAAIPPFWDANSLLTWSGLGRADDHVRGLGARLVLKPCPPTAVRL